MGLDGAEGPALSFICQPLLVAKKNAKAGLLLHLSTGPHFSST